MATWSSNDISEALIQAIPATLIDETPRTFVAAAQSTKRGDFANLLVIDQYRSMHLLRNMHLTLVRLTTHGYGMATLQSLHLTCYKFCAPPTSSLGTAIVSVTNQPFYAPYFGAAQFKVKKIGIISLVPRLHPAFQCWTVKSRRAWYMKLCE